MSEPHIGEIRLFAGTFAPRGWAFCDGQQLWIWEYDTLFSLIGTTYGGDGMTQFALPDLRGRVPLHQGQGPERVRRTLGEVGGQEFVTLTPQTLPTHTHTVRASQETATSRTAVGQAPAALPGSGKAYAVGPAETVLSQASPVGGGQPHENRQPFLALHYIIALEGIYPSFS